MAVTFERLKLEKELIAFESLFLPLSRSVSF